MSVPAAHTPPASTTSSTKATARVPFWVSLPVDAVSLAAGCELARVVAPGAAAAGFLAREPVYYVVAAWLFVLLALTWRAAAMLTRLVRRSLRDSATDRTMEDRADPGASAARTVVGVLGYGDLLRNLVLKDLKLKYRGSVFGFLWSLVNPLMMIVVYSTAFTYILRIRAEGYVFYLLLGVLAWTFFSNSASMSTGSVVDSGGLVKSAVFPRVILPAATVLFNLSQYLLTIVVFLPLMLVLYRVAPAPPMLLFPVFLALQVIFTIGVALILATGTAFFRDVRHILEIALSVLFWATPIVYQVRELPELIRTLILLSPLSPFVMAYQQIFYYHQWPDPSVWVVAVLYAAAAAAVGLRLFVTYEDRFAELV